MDFGKKIILDFNELEHFEFPINEKFELQINHENVKYEFLIRIAKENKNLICFGTGATDRDKLNPPYYSRHSWIPKLKESVIIYNDPTLYLNSELRLGWGVGKNDSWYLERIAKIIKIIAIKNNILMENTVFFGTSGAGFMSIMLSTILKKSTSIVNNPQTNVRHWHIFDKMISSCFDSDLDSILNSYGFRFNVIEFFKKENYVPPIIYIVNTGEKKDIMNHLLPFIEGIQKLEINEKINIILYYSSKAHDGILTFEEVNGIIKNHFNQKSNNVKKNHSQIYENINTSGHIGEITENIIITQPIKIPENMEEEGNEKLHIEILMATFKRKNKGKIEIAIRQDNITETVQINTLEIKDNQYKKITFNSTSFKKGDAFLLIKGIDCKNGKAVTAYITKDSEYGSAIVDKKPINGSLIIKSYVQ